MASLWRPDALHRDAYVSPAVFERERRTFLARAWTFVAHASQVPDPGDFITLDLIGLPLLVIRDAEGGIRVFYNRCAHKGAKLVTQPCGQSRLLRCPYHAWSYRTDGSLQGVPMRSEYAASGFADSPSARGLAPVGAVHIHRDFVFVRISEHGSSFTDYFGGALQWLDLMADRSPSGRLEVAGGILRNEIRCNWKVYLENINDVVHPVSTHESAGKAAKAVWSGQESTGPVPLPVQQLLPFANAYDYFARMDAQVHAGGHSALGVSFSTHSAAHLPDGYRAAMAAAYGKQRSAEILGRSPQNVVLYPSIAFKCSPLVLRVVRPLAHDRTLVEAWSFRAVDAPDLLLEQALTYNRLVFSPMSVVAHDDIHLFESIQQALHAPGNEWVSLHRGHVKGRDEIDGPAATIAGTDERLLRNQYRAWAAAVQGADHA
jgi:phenylpropionate dioxygenase-like ring-hydroxylating dioxygenase large terminal subunit